jgi:Family of unknown function (DUF5686)
MKLGRFLLGFVFIALTEPLVAQQIVINGRLKDIHSDEAIPFATVRLLKTGYAKLSDSAGNFRFIIPKWTTDSLLVSYAGFEDTYIRLDTSLKSINITIGMERGRPKTEVIVKGKINRGLLLWRRIVKNKPLNDRSGFSNFGYEVYNKLEIDLNRVNREKMEKGIIPPKPFKFILDNIDTSSEEHPILPLYLTETISDYFYQSDPKKTREIIKANKTIGVKNESFSKLLGGMYQNINVYQNFIPVFDLSFVSPLSDNGDAYYNYKVPDTQFIAGKRYFHLVFFPKNKGTNTFQGDAWIADTSYAVQKMNLRLSPTANVNFIEKLSLVQEFQLIGDSTWFLAKDKFVADFSVLGKKSISFIGRKTTTYKSILINNPVVSRTLTGEKLPESVEITGVAMDRTDSFWNSNRHEALNRNEQAIYQMADTLMKSESFKSYSEWINFIGSGYRNIGNYQIGPWFNWMSYNLHEGYRMRFDLGTNGNFSKRIYLAGYLAYGFADKAFKGKFETIYQFNKSPRHRIHALWKNDIDFGQTYFDDVSFDNIFTLAVRKEQVPIKLIRIDQQMLEYYREWKSGLSFATTITRKKFDPLRNLPRKDELPAPDQGEAFNNLDFSLRVRFAYMEKFLESEFFRTSLGSDYPITELRISRGIPGLLGSGYRYTKLNLSVSDYSKIAPLGSIYYNFYAGKVYGTLPYMLMNIAPGNEIYYYNRYAFNLMNRYEYLMDRFAGMHVEHHFGNGMFRWMPYNRILKFRQFWNVKTIWGDMSDANRNLNFNKGYSFSDLNGRTYVEVGTGIDNIMRFFRLDLVWRVTPSPLPKEGYKRFGVFGSFRLGF